MWRDASQDELSAPKTKILVEALERWGVDPEGYALLILNKQLPAVELSARNVEKVNLNIVDQINVYDVLRADNIVIEQSAIKYIQEFYSGNKEFSKALLLQNTAPALKLSP